MHELKRKKQRINPRFSNQDDSSRLIFMGRTYAEDIQHLCYTAGIGLRTDDEIHILKKCFERAYQKDGWTGICKLHDSLPDEFRNLRYKKDREPRKKQISNKDKAYAEHMAQRAIYKK